MMSLLLTSDVSDAWAQSANDGYELVFSDEFNLPNGSQMQKSGSVISVTIVLGHVGYLLIDELYSSRMDAWSAVLFPINMSIMILQGS